MLIAIQVRHKNTCYWIRLYIKMALGTKKHFNKQLSKHCNYKNENQQFFQITVLLSHDSTWNCKQRNPLGRRANSQPVSCIFLRESLKNSDELNPQQTYQNPSAILNLHFLWVTKCAPRNLLDVLKILQHMKVASKFSIGHICKKFGLAEILELNENILQRTFNSPNSFNLSWYEFPLCLGELKELLSCSIIQCGNTETTAQH